MVQLVFLKDNLLGLVSTETHARIHLKVDKKNELNYKLLLVCSVKITIPRRQSPKLFLILKHSEGTSSLCSSLKHSFTVLRLIKTQFDLSIHSINSSLISLQEEGIFV